MSLRAAAAEKARDDEFLQDVLQGLSAPAKFLLPKYFYDDRGSAIYGEITRLPEYYPTRTETRLMERIGGELAAACGDRETVVEFGSGSGRRSEILLQALGDVQCYVPIDVSEQLLQDTRSLVARIRPGINVRPVLADFTAAFRLPADIPPRRLGFFPGSTIGNFLPVEALAFLSQSRQVLGQDAQLLIGTDLVKPVEILEAAYDDAAGVTARFNRNLLHRINCELDGDFDLDAFYHRAFYDPAFQRVEMHLVSEREQEVSIGGIRRFQFRRGESIHTENSHKFTVEGFKEQARRSGWRPLRHWVDERGWFAIHLLGRA